MRLRPAVSIVIATYNRPSALACALESVRLQSVEDWEVLVVGDACTGTTASTVEQFDDPRVRFVNMPFNFGEQSGPNNVGIARSSAPLVAFLNHDDLWLPDHLEHSIAVIEARSADLTFSPNFTVIPRDRDDRLAIVLDSLPDRRGRYDPGQIDRATVASGWLVRRETLERLKGWRAASECRVEPSQDLLWRAHRSGMRLWSTGVPSVITIASGVRRDSYHGDDASEQRRLLERVGDAGLRLELLARCAESTATRQCELGRPRRAWFWALRRLTSVRLSPRAVDYTIRRRLRRGALIESLRSIRGLEPTFATPTTAASMRRAEVGAACAVFDDVPIEFREGGNGVRYCASGWSAPEEWGTWNDGTAAELIFRSSGNEVTAELTLAVVAHVDAEHPRQRLLLETADDSSTIVLDGAGPHQLSIKPLFLGARPQLVRLGFPDAWSPAVDRRRLAVGLISASVNVSA